MIQLAQIFTISNIISFFRLLLAIPFWFLLDDIHSGSMRYYIFGICLFASFTDILDGYLARKLKQVTEFGKIIDPLADKIAVGVIIIKLFILDEIPFYYFLMIIGRDLLIFCGGILLSLKIDKVLPSNALGKITVIIIGIVILLIILQMNRNSIPFLFFYGLSIVLCISSLIGYGLRAFEFLKKKNYESV